MPLQQANSQVREELIESKLRLERLELLVCELLRENECLRMALTTGDDENVCGNPASKGARIISTIVPIDLALIGSSKLEEVIQMSLTSNGGGQRLSIRGRSR